MKSHNIEIKGYIPGAIGRIAELHAAYYHQEWGFGIYFEAKVATEMSQFLTGFKEGIDGFWTACQGNRVQGAVAIDSAKIASEGAHLRWYIVSPELHGRGIGRSLLEHAIRFCRKHNYQKVFLWTFEGLDTARHLYEEYGFRMVFQQEGSQWGTSVNEQKFVLKI
jgi:N-acetylglutamate synthase-like GNAT family acetyltransferase